MNDETEHSVYLDPADLAEFQAWQDKQIQQANGASPEVTVTQAPPRQTAVFPFQDHDIELYQPTEGQMVAVAVAVKRDQATQLTRLWMVIESLFTDPADWEWFDLQLVTGKSTMAEITTWADQVFKHKWPVPPAADSGQ